ncbi:MAG: hypothetical protein MUC56_09940 [Thermoanaerobaculales bacterium]|jgi:hypothetical protein|nr:hypothetical protein [Thermoanaerobaculales bacterium]
MDHSSHIIVAIGAALAATVVSAVEPPPHPSPPPGTLAELASRTELTRARGAGPIVITDANLSALADGAVVTVLETTVADLADPAGVERVDPKLRERWRRAVLSQSAVVARLEARRAAVETEIDRLGRGRLDARALARIDAAKTKLELAEAEVRREQAELSRLIREARKQGARPGWFR